MNLLLTSSGIRNRSIRNALVDLLGKPVEESNALFIPTAIYPFPGGPGYAWDAIGGNKSSSLAQLGWKSLGILELTALPSIDKKAWAPSIENTDALLFWGGDPLYLAYWIQRSGLKDLMPSLRREIVYVGVSAGSMAACTTFGETFTTPPNMIDGGYRSEEIIFDSPNGKISRTFVTYQGAGLVDFAIIPHLDNKNHHDASMANAEKWAAKLSVPVYAIDDETAIKVKDGKTEVISEGHWKLFGH